MGSLHKKLNYAGFMQELRKLFQRDELNHLPELYDLKNGVTYQTTGKSLNGHPSREVSNIPLDPSKKWIFDNNATYKVTEFRCCDDKGKPIDVGSFLIFASNEETRESFVVRKSMYQNGDIKYNLQGIYATFGANRMWQMVGTSEMFKESNDPNCKYDYDNARKNAFNNMRKYNRV